MKKAVILILVFAFSLAQLSAQQPIFVKGSQTLNLGLGLGSTLYTGSHNTIGIPPLSASFEVGVVDHIADKGSIGVGGYLGFSSHRWEYSTWEWKYTNVIIGGRGTFHYPLVDKLDTYTGILLGYNIVSAREFGTPIYGFHPDSSTSNIAYAWFIGARYYFTNEFAAMAEFGYGITYLNIGIALSF
jgi:opacity protein-like surface antigen